MSIRTRWSKVAIWMRVLACAAAVVVLAAIEAGIDRWVRSNESANRAKAQGVGEDTDQEPIPETGLSNWELQYVSDPETEITVYQLDRMRSCPGFSEYQKSECEVWRFRQSFTPALSESAIVRIVAFSGFQRIWVITTNHKIGIEDLVGRGNRGTQLDVKGRTVYAFNGREYLIDGNHVAFAGTHQIQELLNSAKDPSVTDLVNKAIRQADFSKPQCFVNTFSDRKHSLSGLVVPGTLSEFYHTYWHGIFSHKSPNAVVADADFQTPTNVRFRIICRSQESAQSKANYFRDPECRRQLGPLGNCSVEVNDTTVTLRVAVQPRDICNIPALSN